jgi:hypothetical protein
MSGHTEGKWNVSPARGADGEFLIVGGEGKQFGLIAAVSEVGDAHLIAAAPEMYEALKALQLQALQSTVNDPANEWGQEALDMARAVLKSIGGQ